MSKPVPAVALAPALTVIPHLLQNKRPVRQPVGEIAGGDTKDVIVSSFTTAQEGTFTISGSVYRAGQTGETEQYEMNLADNSRSLSYTVIKKPELNISDLPNYRAGSNVITSFRVDNRHDVDYTPDEPLIVTMRVYFNGTHVYADSMEVIVPAFESQFVWFTWTVPNSVGIYRIVFSVEDENGGTLDEVEKSCQIVSKTVDYATDYGYSDRPPEGWMQPTDKPFGSTDRASWTVWEYKNGAFEEVTYEVSARAGTLSVVPNSKTAYQQNGHWYMKSGYGLFISAGEAILSGNGANHCTGAQWGNALFAEFGYSHAEQSSMELVSGAWMPYQKQGAAADDPLARLHYVPIWYPNTTSTATAYYVKVELTEIWTPAGMLTVSAVSDEIWIEGTLFDDWYT